MRALSMSIPARERVHEILWRRPFLLEVLTVSRALSPVTFSKRGTTSSLLPEEDLLLYVGLPLEDLQEGIPEPIFEGGNFVSLGKTDPVKVRDHPLANGDLRLQYVAVVDREVAGHTAQEERMVLCGDEAQGLPLAHRDQLHAQERAFVGLLHPIPPLLTRILPPSKGPASLWA